MDRSLLTIGYEGSTLADFLETLRLASVKTVIDVRDLPLSRKAGFSKNALSEALQECGIAYLHLKELGDPKEGRDAARAGEFDEFRRIYRARLKSSAARAELKEAVGIASKGTSCLLCYERDPKMCHRSMVAKSMCDLAEFRLIHLGIREGAAKRSRTRSSTDESRRIRKVG